jgi:hypothetical protein
MTHADSIGGRDFQNSSSAYCGSLGFSDFVTATLLHETQSPNWVNQKGVKPPKKLGFEECAFDTNKGCAFDTSLLTHEIDAQTAQELDLLSENSASKVRYLIVSNDSKPPLGCKPVNQQNEKAARPKKTNNRKKITHEQFIEYSGAHYEINNVSQKTGKAYGVFEPIMLKLLEQLHIATQIHGKVFVFRFDLSISSYTVDSRIISNFRKKLIQKLKREYQMIDIGFAWVREQEKSKQQHYHLVYFLDGQKVWHHQGLSKIVKEISTRDSNITRVVFAGFHQVDDDRSLRDAIYHISYLAKIRGKGYRPSKSHDFGSSRLKEFAA